MTSALLLRVRFRLATSAAVPPKRTDIGRNGTERRRDSAAAETDWSANPKHVLKAIEVGIVFAEAGAL